MISRNTFEDILELAFGQWPIDLMDRVGIAALEDRLDALEVVPPALGG
jgi:hypothetical protein